MINYDTWSVLGSTGWFLVLLGQFGALLVGTWWYSLSIWWYWLIYDGTGLVEGSSGWYLVVLGQYNLVLIGIKWYWVDKRLLCLYILKKNNGDVNQPTDRANIEQSAFSKVRK